MGFKLSSGAAATFEIPPYSYYSTYCNKGHRMRDGKPIEHECRIIPPAALWAERELDFDRASEIMRSKPVRMMLRGVKYGS